MLDTGKRVQELKDTIGSIQEQCASVKKKRKALEAELDALDRHPPSSSKKAATTLATKVQKPAQAAKAKQQKRERDSSEEKKETTLKEQVLALMDDSDLSDHGFCEDLCKEMGGGISLPSLRRWLGLHDGGGVSAKLTEQIEAAIQPVLAKRHKKK